MRGLSLENVMMAYGPRVLFAGVTVQMEPGETLVVTGANGSGKSTLLKIIAGLLRPEEGIVQREQRLGYAAPDMNPYVELTGRENLEFFGGLLGSAEQPSHLLEQVGLPLRTHGDLAGTYSSGMRQRLKLALSLLGAPSLLVWDEPTLALDASGKQCVDDLLAQHRQKGGTAVLATNDIREDKRWSADSRRLNLSYG